jgi:transcriptional regulator with XRE-family HTH domain
LRISDNLTDKAVLKEIGVRLRETRLRRDLPQDWIAKEAGVSAPTITKLENGGPVQLITLIRVLRALDLLGGLEVAVPEPAPSPIEMLRHQEGRRRRASRGAGERAHGDRKPWRWGDER